MFESPLHTLTTPLGTLEFDRWSMTKPHAFIQTVTDDITSEREVVAYPEQDLAYVGDQYDSARVLTLIGMMRADTVAQYIAERQRIKGWVNQLRRADGLLQWTPPGMEPMQMVVRRHEAPQISAKATSRGMLISLIAGDPRVYAQAEKSVELVGATNIGFTSPFTGPITPSGTGADVIAHNAGDADSVPTSRWYGPATNPLLINISTGEQVVTDGLIIGDGEYLEVRHGGRPSMLLNGSELADRYRYRNPRRSKFFSIAPGDNVLRFIASSTGPNTRAVVSWHDAHMP